MSLNTLFEKHHPYLIETRRYLHENPELSGQEKNTSAYLKEEVKKLGLVVQDVSNYGFVAILDTKRPGKTLGLRTDIDALPISEPTDNLVQKRVTHSKNPGVMHACGHDGHMAILLTSMKILIDSQDQLNGKIIFIFEEGEELALTAHIMAEYLSTMNVDAIYGLHLASFMDSGKIAVDAGPIMAGSITLDLTIHGKSGHSSRPDLAINPIFAGSQVLANWSTAWTNTLDPNKTITMGISQFHAGNINNQIPDSARIGGTIRFFDEEQAKEVFDTVNLIAKTTAQMHQCEVTFDPTHKISVLPVINDSQLVDQVKQAALKHDSISFEPPVKWFASETFSKYSLAAPTVFAFVGIKNDTFGSGAEHHNIFFDIDEDGLEAGVLTTTQFALDFLQ